MRIIFSYILLIFLYTNSYSQVINVETLRKVTDSAKWTGSVSLDLSIIKNKNNIFKIANKAHIQYNNKKELWLFVNDLKFEKLEGNSFVNKGTQHLRYNRKVSEKVKMEVFYRRSMTPFRKLIFEDLQVWARDLNYMPMTIIGSI